MTQVVAVVGPTASGKTALAVELAKALDSEIISADSMQFYRGMEIGTGAPSAEELSAVRHHFIGSLDPAEEISAGIYSAQARDVVATLNAQGKCAVLVGGSGLYIRAVIDGIFEGPSKDPELRQRLADEAEAIGVEALYTRLREVDPAYAEIVSSNDLRRIVRGLEVYQITGRPLSELHGEHQADPPTLDTVQVALLYPREILYERINRRVDSMVAAGFLEEVQRLLDDGLGEHVQRLKSLGYREIAAHLRGECTLEEALEQTKMFSRRYAKRQLTWFRGDDRIHWYEVAAYASIADIRDAILARV